MKIQCLSRFLGLLLAIMACGVYAATDTVDDIVKQARSKATEGDLESAASLYYKALQMGDMSPRTRRELANILIKGQVEDPYAEQSDGLKLIEARISEPSFLATHFPLAFLSNAVLNANDEPMSRQVLLILKKLQTNDNETAIKMAQVLQRNYPGHPVPYNLLGLAWQGKGDPSKAEEFFQRALALRESFHAARINLAELELHLGDFLAAHQQLDTVLEVDNNNRRACLVKAHLYNLEGRSELAKQWYSKVSEQL